MKHRETTYTEPVGKYISLHNALVRKFGLLPVSEAKKTGIYKNLSFTLSDLASNEKMFKKEPIIEGRGPAWYKMTPKMRAKLQQEKKYAVNEYLTEWMLNQLKLVKLENQNKVMSKIVEIKKNKTNYVQIELREYEGNPYVDVREFFDSEDGKRLPTKKGITFSPNVLEQVISGLSQIKNNIEK
jgi:hypothetical protein|tara:strand:+ start:70 stop:621 length:552 start_codon:yes stop_codon:yes gene_type:complete